MRGVAAAWSEPVLVQARHGFLVVGAQRAVGLKHGVELVGLGEVVNRRDLPCVECAAQHGEVVLHERHVVAVEGAHEAGGLGFGKLGDEYIYHNAFIDFCGCSCCGHVFEFEMAKANGWYDNLSLVGKMHEVPWSHLIFDDRYSDIVDIFEGGFMHNRGVFRSEQNSCMNNDIPYYSTISRESIVKRIKRYAGETYSFEEFVANDKRDAGAVTRSADVKVSGSMMHSRQAPPQIHKGSPLKKRR